MADKKDIQANMYIFKKGILWFAWIIERQTPIISYTDNSPFIYVEPETNIRYLTFSLSQKKVRKRLIKFVEKRYNL